MSAIDYFPPEWRKECEAVASRILKERPAPKAASEMIVKLVHNLTQELVMLHGILSPETLDVLAKELVKEMQGQIN